MFASLRTRLLISYIAIILAMLCVVTLALIVLLVNNPVAQRAAYQNLAVVARSTAPLLQNVPPERINDRLVSIADANDIRIVRIGPDAVVQFDSDGKIQPGTALDLGRQIRPQAAQQGIFRDQAGSTWLYIATPPAQGPDNIRIVFAARQPRTPIRTLIRENTVLRPVVQAGFIGLVMAIVVAILISNWISRPLNRVAGAANAIASGRYEQRAPMEGPREVKAVAQAFNEMADRVQRTQKTQRDFLANATHELKTPLTSIQGYSQAILDEATPRPEQAAQVIYDEAGRMRRLVEDLLDLSRIESGQAPFRHSRVNVTALLDAVLANLSVVASERRVGLTQVLNSPPEIVADGDRLAQVFTNLIDNAITHTPAGGQVTVLAETRDGGAQVSVVDTGPGIPAAELNRVFERFYQIDKSRARSHRNGTGLGLAIAREIVEAHSGRIGAASTHGGGTTFTVWLPAARPDDVTPSHKSSGGTTMV
jgi:signal transduction histidine kinase